MSHNKRTKNGNLCSHEAQSHFMSKTRILTKNTKNWTGRKKPEETIDPNLVDLLREIEGEEEDQHPELPCNYRRSRLQYKQRDHLLGEDVGVEGDLHIKAKGTSKAFYFFTCAECGEGYNVWEAHWKTVCKSNPNSSVNRPNIIVTISQ